MIASDKLCLSPYLDRLNYFYGQMLGVRDFQTEQDYFREKIKLHNRCLHGFGVVCGLEVKFKEFHREPDKTCWPIVTIGCGLALDADGNELIVREPLCVDLRRCLSKKDQEALAKENLDKPITCYLSLRFRETPLEPIRPVALEACGDSKTCHFGKLRDSVCCSATLAEPADDYVCDPCCAPGQANAASDDSCCHGDGPPILLASITFTRDGNVKEVDNRLRVLLGQHATKIVGVNWVHGGNYHPEQADLLLQHGLRIRFSRPVREATLQPGVVDVLLYMGGGSISGDVKHLTGKLKAEKDKTEKVIGLIYDFEKKKRERLDPGDRIHVIFRSAFVLDACCRPIDGLHVGGWVPRMEEAEKYVDHPPAPVHIPDDCVKRVGPFANWASGTGAAGGNFESWFYVSESPDQGQKT